jgi:hypothetical protein
MKCLVCNLGEVGEEDSHDICKVCGRENERYGTEENEFGGANYFCIKDHRDLWVLDGSRSWNVSGATNIDRLAKYIEDDLDINKFEKSIADYRRVVEECKRLLNNPISISMPTLNDEYSKSLHQ